MTHKHQTKDESFIINLYTEAQKSGDLGKILNRYEIGKLTHLQERGVNAICKLLVQANFIKKADEVNIYLTPHGVKLALRLLSE